jgi:hypothetical protein
MKREHTVQRTFVDPYRRRVARMKVTDTVHSRASGGAVKGIGDTKDSYLSGKGSPWSVAHQPKKK